MIINPSYIVTYYLSLSLTTTNSNLRLYMEVPAQQRKIVTSSMDLVCCGAGHTTFQSFLT